MCARCALATRRPTHPRAGSAGNAHVRHDRSDGQGDRRGGRQDPVEDVRARARARAPPGDFRLAPRRRSVRARALARAVQSSQSTPSGPSSVSSLSFQEEQYSEPSPFFDRRQTVSGVGRGEQRRIYDERKRTIIPKQGLRLVLIDKSAFVVRSKQIVRDRARDIEIVQRFLGPAAPLAIG